MKRSWTAWILMVCVLLGACMPTAMADVWGLTAETTLYGSSPNKLSNLAQAVEALDGTVVFYGDTFSFNDTIGPRTKELGYYSAMNGRGVKVIGGGVSQLATTLYLAARECDYLTFDEFKSYDEDFKDWYVDNGEERA